MLRERWWVVPVAAVAPLLWGTTYATTTELLPPERPLTAAALRALPAGVLLLVLARRLPPRGWWWRAGVLGTLNIGAFFALLFVGAYRLPGGVAATVGALQPLVVLGLAVLLLGERAGRRAVLAALLGVAGVALLVLRAEARLDAVGLAAATGGAVSMAVGVVLAKRWGRPAPLLAVTSWQLLAGGLVLVPVALAVEGPLPPRLLDAPAVAGYAWLALAGTALAYVVWFLGVGALPSGALSSLGLLAPVVATATGWLLLGQSLTAWQVAGGVLVLTAVVLAQRAPRRPVPRVAADPAVPAVAVPAVPAVQTLPARCLPLAP